MDYQTTSNVFAFASNINGRLPDHHPNLLKQYLIWGLHDLVKHLLFLLYRFVRLTIESEGTFTDVPVPLLRLLQEKENSSSASKNEQYNELFETNIDNENAFDETSSSDFNQSHALYLSEQLTRISLPHVSSVDQMNLLALIDTVIQIEKQKRSLDENGVRYLLAVRMLSFTSRSLPKTISTDFSNRDIAWAFYSDSQDTLVDICNNSYDNKLTWKLAKSMGVGLWLRNIDTLVYCFNLETYN